MPESKLKGAAIVLVGSFNPRIFQPAWFGAQNLIRSSEAENAKIEVITSDLSVFETDWFKLVVTHERFQIVTIQPDAFDPLRDLVAGTFSLLTHTPVQKLGLNFDEHFQIESEDRWHAFGDLLAPKPVWQKLFTGRVGMLSLKIQAPREDGDQGLVIVTVEPSTRFHPGIYIGVNNHFDLPESSAGESAAPAVERLKSTWSTLLREAADLTAHLVGQVPK
jgi:hypothetical protein